MKQYKVTLVTQFEMFIEAESEAGARHQADPHSRYSHVEVKECENDVKS